MKFAIGMAALLLVAGSAQAAEYVAAYNGVGTSGDIVGQPVMLSFRFTDTIGGTCCTPDYFERQGTGLSNPVESVSGTVGSFSFDIDFRGRGAGQVAQYDLTGNAVGLQDWLLHHVRIEGQYYFNVNLRAEFVGPASPGDSLHAFDYAIKPEDETYGLIYDFDPGGFGAGQFRANHVSVSRIDAAVPEPASWSLLLLGFFGVGSVIRRNRCRVTMLPTR